MTFKDHFSETAAGAEQIARAIPRKGVTDRVARAEASGLDAGGRAGQAATNFSAPELMQYRSRVGGGPSSKMCPK